jgi:SAM-dependent methyltransferase
MTNPLFIDQNQRIVRGEEAKRALEGHNDAQFLTEGKGVIKVPAWRWSEAQHFEQQHWMRQQFHINDDRNYTHAHYFDNYIALKGRKYRSAIELGCGPFTNMRLIGGQCEIKRVTLLDPLIEDYLQHPYCRFSRDALHCETSLDQRLRKPGFRRTQKLLRRLAPGLMKRSIPIEELIVSSIEEMPTRNRHYDLVVMINVIEHCFDIDQIFQNILSMSAPQSLFVFHDKYYEDTHISEQLRTILFDAGHPLRIDRKVIQDFLTRNFKSIYLKHEQQEHRFEDLDLSYEAVYFIGELITV